MNRQDQKAVTELLTQYSKALNSSDAEALAGLYVSDGLFMPNGALPIKGTQIGESAKRFMSQNQISLAFEIKEIVVDGDFAFVQANSSSTVQHHRAGGGSKQH